jgi:hypothetical protein
MKLQPLLFVAIGTAGLVATASTASADATMTMAGHYIYTETSTAGQTINSDWYVASCGNGCINISLKPNASPSDQARLVKGQWTMDSVGDTGDCADGTTVPDAMDSHSVWDGNTLTGTVLVTYKKNVCGQNILGQQFTHTMALSRA